MQVTKQGLAATFSVIRGTMKKMARSYEYHALQGVGECGCYSGMKEAWQSRRNERGLATGGGDRNEHRKTGVGSFGSSHEDTRDHQVESLQIFY